MNNAVMARVADRRSLPQGNGSARRRSLGLHAKRRALPEGAAKLGAGGLVPNGLNVAGKRFQAGAAKGRLAAPQPSVIARAIVMSRRLRITRLRSIDRRPRGWICITVMCL